MLPRRTNQTQEARVYSDDGPIGLRKAHSGRGVGLDADTLELTNQMQEAQTLLSHFVTQEFNSPSNMSVSSPSGVREPPAHPGRGTPREVSPPNIRVLSRDLVVGFAVLSIIHTPGKPRSRLSASHVAVCRQGMYVEYSKGCALNGLLVVDRRIQVEHLFGRRLRGLHYVTGRGGLLSSGKRRENIYP
eukprot:1191773-Prorocentrum_minimum.AAC.1